LSRRTQRRSLDRRGASLIYIGIAMFAITGIVSMGVDIGWIRVARSQLQTAADASALAGALSLPDADATAAKNKAISFAQDSSYDFAGSQVSMQSGDITLGLYWTPDKTFYAVGETIPGQGNSDYVVQENDSNAMRVIGNRTAARSNPLPLFFARIFGRTQIDVTATATAYVRGGPTGTSYGIVGLSGIDSNGNNASIDSYLPPNITPLRANAKVASNGDIDLGNGDIYGDARPGIGHHVFGRPNSVVTGYTAPLTETLVFPPASAPGGAIPLGNFSESTLAAGIYTATKFDPLDGFIVTGGVAEVYVTGDVTLSGNININAGLASNLRIYVIGNHQIKTNGISTIRCWLYAPTSTMRMVGTTDFYGAIVAESINFLGTGMIHYDESHSGGSEEDAFTVVLIK
jgi:Flp pilus assembly protein TadG